MFKAFVLSKKKIVIVTALLASAAMGGLIYNYSKDSQAVSGSPGQPRTIHMVTGEFKSTTEDGKEIEAYRWDPGNIYIKKGETVNLSIFGVNGASHPFIIEGTNIKGEVKKGKETIVPFKADKEGIYRLLCLTHPDIAHHGPMIAYIVVD
ncbi:hypothetical protein [Paenibacillus sp. J2TS4]|uniref:hypothetical protein n=1 Tax=Paenibacillus sp. J2TS4 TaxID=2807194 RepID=UPI001B2D58C3|nr:hypothetical protein [Paenibacillus sp. J2TS4]GIP35426.1 hypothetical protein J2TS4_46360 [Paenibacillus sp. J2TS4]